MKVRLIYLLGMAAITLGGCEPTVSKVAVGLNAAEPALELEISDKFGAASERLVQSGYWEIVGRRFVAFRLARQDERYGHFSSAPMDGVYHGWLQSVGDGESVVLSTDGRFYEISEVLGDAEFGVQSVSPSDRAAYDRVSELAPRQQVHLASAAVYHLVGDDVRARRSFNLANQSQEVRRLPFESEVSWDAELMESLLMQGQETAYSLFVRGLYADSLEIVERMEEAFSDVAPPEGSINRAFLNMDWAADFKRDLQWRIGGMARNEPAWKRDYPTTAPSVQLVDSLATAHRSIIDPSVQEEVQAMIDFGDEIVSPAIDASGYDWRFTKMWRRPNPDVHFLMLQSVSEVCNEMLSTIWVGMPTGAPNDGSTGDRKSYSNWLKNQWSEHITMSAGQRLLTSIGHPQLDSKAALRSLRKLITDEGTIRKNFQEQLSASDFQSISDMLSKRLSDAQDRTGSSFEASAEAELAVILAYISGMDSLPVLKEYSGDLAEELVSGNKSSWRNLGAPFGTVIAQRIALGDQGAIDDYREVLGSFVGFGFNVGDVFRPAWEYPSDEGLQKLVMDTVVESVKEVRGDEGFTATRTFWNGMRLDWVLSEPALFEQLRADLLDEKPIATLQKRIPGAGSGFRIVSLTRRAAAEDSQYRTVGEVTRGELLADGLVGKFLMESDFWGKSKEEREILIDRLVDLLENPDKDVLKQAQPIRPIEQMPLFRPSSSQ